MAESNTKRGKSTGKPPGRGPRKGQPAVPGGAAPGAALAGSRPTPASRPGGSSAPPGRASAEPHEGKVNRRTNDLAMGLTAPVAKKPAYEPPDVPGWPKWAGPFLKALSEVGIAETAAYKVGLFGRKHAFLLRKHDPQFRDEWSKALGVAHWEAERTIRLRALHGWTERQVRYDSQGNEVECIEKEKFSPALAMRLMEVNNPERWGRKQEVYQRSESVVITGELQKRITADPKLAELICKLDEMLAAPAPPVTEVEALPAPAEDVPDGEG